MPSPVFEQAVLDTVVPVVSGLANPDALAGECATEFPEAAPSHGVPLTVDVEDGAPVVARPVQPVDDGVVAFQGQPPVEFHLARLGCRQRDPVERDADALGIHSRGREDPVSGSGHRHRR